MLPTAMTTQGTKLIRLLARRSMPGRGISVAGQARGSAQRPEDSQLPCAAQLVRPPARYSSLSRPRRSAA